MHILIAKKAPSLNEARKYLIKKIIEGTYDDIYGKLFMDTKFATLDYEGYGVSKLRSPVEIIEE
jgi:hypothetical protein